jgi:large subunit ribosomal protein L15
MPLTLDKLRAGPGAHRDRKRVGRGHGSGKGKTAGRGTKGQKARSGAGVGRGFEGGQLPIQQRMPYKRGFTNIYRTQWQVVNLGRLDALDVEAPITPQLLFELGITRGKELPLKVLAGGDLTRPLTIHAHAFSKAARAAVEERGGTVEQLERTDDWVQARPRTRRLPLNRALKNMRVGKAGGPTRREAIATLAAKKEA